MKVLCAAIMYNVKMPYVDDNGNEFVIISGHRHHNILHTMHTLGYKQDLELEQGFLSDNGSFLSREEALEVAIKAGQVERFKTVNKFRLFSEDLY